MPTSTPQKVEKQEFFCTPREGRKIAENLRYTAAARAMFIAAAAALQEWSYDDLSTDTMSALGAAVDRFRETADE